MCAVGAVRAVESAQGGDTAPAGRWWQLPLRLQRRPEISREAETALCRAFAASSLLDVQVCVRACHAAIPGGSCEGGRLA